MIDTSTIHPDRLRAMQAQCLVRRGGCPCIHASLCPVPTQELLERLERERQEMQRRKQELLNRRRSNAG